MEMMLTARTVGAEEAAALGLANQVLPAENFIEHVHHFCQEMLSLSWFTLRANKRLMQDTDGMGLDAGLAHEIFKSEGRGPDMAERIGGFGEK
mgnify:FL=1